MTKFCITPESDRAHIQTSAVLTHPSPTGQALAVFNPITGRLMKPTDSDTHTHAGNTADTRPAGTGRIVLIAGLWLISVGFWLWAGVQLGQLIGELWF